MWPRGWVEVQLYSSMTAALEGGEWSAARPGLTLPPGKTQYPLYRRLAVPQGRSGRTEDLVATGIRSRTVQHVAQSLYRLSYPALYISNKLRKNRKMLLDTKHPRVQFKDFMQTTYKHPKQRTVIAETSSEGLKRGDRELPGELKRI